MARRKNSEVLSEPAVALGVYAATAATTAIVELRRANLIGEDHINTLLENLTACRKRLGDEPILIELAESLTDLLLHHRQIEK